MLGGFYSWHPNLLYATVVVLRYIRHDYMTYMTVTEAVIVNCESHLFRPVRDCVSEYNSENRDQWTLYCPACRKILKRQQRLNGEFVFLDSAEVIIWAYSVSFPPPLLSSLSGQPSLLWSTAGNREAPYPAGLEPGGKWSETGGVKLSARSKKTHGHTEKTDLCFAYGTCAPRSSSSSTVISADVPFSLTVELRPCQKK